jgi:hypothetical protein
MPLPSTRLPARPPDPKRRRPAFAGPGGAGVQIEAGQLHNKKYPDPPRGATILTIPGRTAIVGGEIIAISPRLAACITRMRDGGPLREPPGTDVLGRARR